MRSHPRPAFAPFAAVVLVALAPVARAQSVGDIVVCYEVIDPSAEGADSDIYAQRITQDGELVWGEDAVTVIASSHIERRPAACSDGRGGVIVAFELEFTDDEHRGDVDIMAQRVSADGECLWDGGATPVSVAASGGKESNPIILSDGRGGAIVVYEWVDEDGDRDILAQRISADGELLWNGGRSPVAVASSPGIERSPAVAPDGRGGIIVFFEWEADDGNIDVMAQRLSSDGELLWNEGKSAVDVSATEHIERHVVAVPDGQGGAIAAFEFEFTEGEHKGDIDIMAQRVSGDGGVLWHDGSDASTVGSGTGLERNPAAIADGVGGIIVAFEYEPTEGEYVGDVDVLAQRLNGQGTMLWNDGDRSVVVSSSKGLERLPSGVSTGDGGALFAFEHESRGGDDDGDIDAFAQRISPGGEMQWNEGERSKMVSSSKWLERSPIALPDGRGGAVIICSSIGREGKYKGDRDVIAQRLDADGNMAWNEGKQSVEVADSDALEQNPCAVLTGAR